jgi:hypothetical protein
MNLCILASNTLWNIKNVLIGAETLPTTPMEARMAKKCAKCHILLDVPCTNPACDGHHNESVGEVCVYCATSERAHMRNLRKLASPLVSTLYDIGHGED